MCMHGASWIVKKAGAVSDMNWINDLQALRVGQHAVGLMPSCMVRRGPL